MLLHIADQRTHQFPEGWAPVGDPLYINDAEVWILEAEA